MVHQQVSLFCDCCSLGARRREQLCAGLRQQGFQVLDGGAESVQGRGQSAGRMVFLGFGDLALTQVAEAAHRWLSRLLATTVLPAQPGRGPSVHVHLAAADGSIHVKAAEGKVVEKAFALLPDLAGLLRCHDVLASGTYLRYLHDGWWITHVPMQQPVYQYDADERRLIARDDIDPQLLSHL